jgi:hypothetical protein
MSDIGVLSLTAALTWGLWRALGEWGDMAACWVVAWAWWMGRMMRGV